MGQSSPQSDDAMQALRQGENQRAIANADTVLQTDPHNCRMLTIRGLALKKLGRTAEALSSFDKADAACPDFLPALEGMAEIEYAQNSPKAADTLNRILAVQPGNPTSHAMLAVLDWKAGHCDQAVDHFAKAGEVIQSSNAAQIQYGACLLALGNNDQAAALFQQMLNREDTSGNRLRYAYACWKAKTYGQASAALAPLLNANTANAQALTLAARIAEASGDTPRAVQLLRQAILAEPKDPRNYLIFAEISFNHSSYQVGIDMLNAGLQQLPQEARLYLARGVLKVELSKMDGAMEDFREAHKLDPQLSFAEDAMGMMLSQHHQAGESLTAYAEQVRKHPDDPLVQYLYAEALSQSENASDSHTITAAIAAAERAVALEPDYQPARDLLCVLQLRAGNLNAVIQHAEEALKRDPNDETAIYQELMANRRLGKKDEVNALAARMKQAHEHQQEARTNYQLQEIAVPGQSNP